MGREVPAYLRKLGYVLNALVKTRSKMRRPTTTKKSVDRKPATRKQQQQKTMQSTDTQTEDGYSTINFTFRTETENFDFENICFGRNGGMSSDNERNLTPKSRRTRSTSCDELIYKLDMLIHRQEKIINLSDEKPQVNKEWHEIAEILDRSLFWIYSVILIMSTIVILVIVPLGKTVSI